MPLNKNWNPIGWAADHPRRATAIVLLIVMWIWTGQTYVWNPFWTLGYQYYPFVIFISAGVLGQLLPHRKRTQKQDPEHNPQEDTKYTSPDRLYANATIGTQLPRIEPDTDTPTPLESLRDDDE